MRLGIRTKQIAGVTAIVGLAVVSLGGWYLASLAQVLLDSSRSRARLLSKAAYQRIFTLVAQGGDPYAAIAGDDGLRAVLESSAYSEGLVYAVVVDPDGRVLADPDPAGRGRFLEPAAGLDDLVDRGGPLDRWRAIWAPGGRTLEIREPLALGGVEFGSIRVGVSTLLVRAEIERRMMTPLVTAAAVLAGAGLVAILLAQLVLRPIHVIHGGLVRLGRGELDVDVDLPADSELAELGDSFRQVTARLSADRTELASQHALESMVDRLEDAVALVAPDGALLFANAAMKTQAGGATLPAGHPYRALVSRAIDSNSDVEPATVEAGGSERLVRAHPVPGADGRPIGALLVARDLAYLGQVASTVSYSRKLTALGRLTAGIAHEIKNPLNATMIHLELLRTQVADRPDALTHVQVITTQVRRLDEVVQGFLKFTRPEDLQLRPVDLAEVFARLMPILDAEAARQRVDLKLDLPRGLPPVEGDATMLEQAFLNLALNAFQAMPEGGRLRIGARARDARLVTIEIEDTGAGIAPEHLSRIFDLYFTTKPEGSGIGLSLVFRTVHLHNGEIEVASTPGRGTTFRIDLPQAARMFQHVGA